MKLHLPLLFACGVVANGAFADHELENRDIARGQALYAETCAACHGPNLEGEPNWRVPKDDGTLPAPPHDVTGHTWHHDTKMLFDYVKLGGAEALAMRGVTDFKSAMPAFRDTLSDEDIWDILGFIRSTWPKRAQEIQASRNPPHS